MAENSTRSTEKVLFLVILANFVAQIPYAVHLYGLSQLLTLSKASLLMGAIFALFLTGYIFYRRGRAVGYWLFIVFLSLEFFFYLFNFVGSLVRGNGLFYQALNPDLILRSVFIIGYINLFASGYFLYLLVLKHRSF